MTKMARALPLLLLSLFSLVTVVFLGGCGKDTAGVTFPQPPAPVPNKWFFDVYGTGPNDIYFCGNLGVMYHFDGNSTWTLQPMGTSAAITTIWGTPTLSTIYAVGHQGHIWSNGGTGWTGMSSGTTEDLYGVGSFQGEIHAVGARGTIRRLNGSSWGDTGTVMVMLDPNGTPTDTLITSEDLSSVVSVNHFFLGGAYFDPLFSGDRFGTDGTLGQVLAPNTTPGLVADWDLRPVSGEQLVSAEWVLAMTSDPADLSRNYMGTSEGWLFGLSQDDNGKYVWQTQDPDITQDPGAGIRDLWVSPGGDVYVATDEGQIVYQTADYQFGVAGSREVLYAGHNSIVSIWGTGPDNIYFTAYVEEVVYHAVHDPLAGTFTVDAIALPFPTASKEARGTGSIKPGFDELGRPLR